MTSHKTIDTIIPVYHPDECLSKNLDILKKQEYPVRKVILMVTENPCVTLPDYSDDPFIEVHTVSADQFDHGGTRNKSVSYSDADYVLFLTEDALVSGTDFTKKLLAPMTDTVVISYARQLPKADCHPIERITRNFNYPENARIKSKEDEPLLGIKTYFSSDVACLYNRSVFTKCGGFTEPVIFNEDMLFSYKLLHKGYKLSYTAEATVYHSHNMTLRELFRRNFDLGVSQADHPEVFQSISSEKEGTSMIFFVLKKLFSTGYFYLVPKFFAQCAAKFLGYKAGKSYHRFSPATIRKWTMNPYYWAKRKDFK